MKVGDLVRYKNWHGGLIGKLIAEDPDYFESWKIEWIIGNSRLRTPKFEWEEDLEVVNESR